jgi:hypothetical protein
MSVDTNTRSLINAALDLAMRVPKDDLTWSIIDRLWKRQDFDIEIRESFFRDKQ